jgi:DinB superfamily/Pentapeptide repeats (8 copies)
VGWCRQWQHEPMPEEFEGDLAGSVFWGADLRGAKFRDVDLTGVTISHALVVNVEIDAFVDNVVINGVDVTAYVNERDPWYPLRAMLRPPDPAGMRATWAALQAAWADTTSIAQRLPDAKLHESVAGEWSFVQTLRHVVFAIDKWFTAPIMGDAFHPMGLANTGSIDFPWPELQYDLAPSATEALAVYADRAARVRSYLDAVDVADLLRPADVLENGPNPIQGCIYVVFEETFWHNRYARRDLAQL